MSSTRQAAKSLARRFGYEVRRSNPSLGDLAAEELPDAHCYQWFATKESVFCPWEGDSDFELLFEGVEPHTIVSRDRCYVLAKLAEHACRLGGDAAECGVYNGGTALLLSRVIAGSNSRLYLFDSFEGLPAGEGAGDKWLEAGQYASLGLESVERVLADYRHSIEIRKGWIPETFDGLADKSFSFAHIDVDRYRAALDCCEYFYPRLLPGGVMVFDDYGFAAAVGERYAVDEFFADRVESPISLPTGQAIVIKLPSPTEEGR